MIYPSTKKRKKEKRISQKNLKKSSTFSEIKVLKYFVILSIIQNLFA